MKQARQLIKSKHDVGAKLVLDPHRHLGIEAMLRTVDVAGEDHAVVVDDRVRGLDGLHLDLRVGRVGLTGELLRQNLLKAGSKRQDLKAARIGVRGPDQFMNRPKPPASSTMSDPGCRYRW